MRTIGIVARPTATAAAAFAANFGYLAASSRRGGRASRSAHRARGHAIVDRTVVDGADIDTLPDELADPEYR